MTTLHELRELETRVSSGDPDAVYLRGMMYWTGRWIEGVVIPQNKRKALDMIQRAADYGHEAAALFIAQHRKFPNVDVEDHDKAKSPDTESANDFCTVPVKPTQSAEKPLPARDRGVAPDLDTEDSWLNETVIGLTGNFVTRIRSSVFYWSAFVSFMLGIYLLDQAKLAGVFLVLILAPFLLLYPPIRFLFGGKDSLAGVVIAFIFEEIIKRKIFKALDDSSRRRRK